MSDHDSIKELQAKVVIFGNTIQARKESLDKAYEKIDRLESLESRLRDYIKHLESWGDFPGADRVARDLREIISPRTINR